MGNDTVHIQFNPDNRVFWTEHTGLHAMSDSELDAAYQRASKFIKDRVKILIKEHKWRDIEFGTRLLLLSYSKGYINRLTLPQSFSTFLDVSQFTDYQTQFENAFEARKSSPSGNDLYIHGPSALADIFYILQCIAPGMLVLTCRSDEEDEIGEKEWVRGLPRDTWVENNAQMLRYILGSKGAYQRLLAACKDQQKAFAFEWIVSWNDDDDCRSTGSTVVDDDWDYNDTKFGWSDIQVIDGTKCPEDCGKCLRCTL
ncbi:hypothetical protein M422DRAFT_53042 [Sphaerobolus stellatus SS14]|uniref:Uncharacterized protein n=1 Tax=Sphaerobolus stellatus (strain SS14) TaxID=990650 RepID=A0A0C9V400_SPHS4|nr:hypothetical protein M422DRAFT_53042 [Sphaerobolus stellatus SS14]